MAIYCLINIEETRKKLKFDNAVTFGIVDPDSDAGMTIVLSVLVSLGLVWFGLVSLKRRWKIGEKEKEEVVDRKEREGGGGG